MKRFQEQLRFEYIKAMTCTLGKRIGMMGIVVCALFLTVYPLALTTEANSPTFAIRMIRPENQIDQSRDFFDLQTYPGGSQVISVELFNLSDQPIRIRARVSTATTNHYVQAEYREGGSPRDSTLPYPMEELVTMNHPEVTIDGNSSIYFPLQIQMPEEGFDGVLAGGINFQMVREESELEGIELLVSFTKVILLWQGELQEPELVLHQVKLVDLEGSDGLGSKDELEEHRFAIVPQEESGDKLVFMGRLQNTQAAFAHGVSIRSQISSLDTGEIVFEETRGELQIVPHSSFNFYTFANRELFLEGYYQITYFIESKGGSWELQRKVYVEGIGLEGTDTTQEELRGEKRVPIIWALIIVLMVIGMIGSVRRILWRKQSIHLRNKR